MGEICDKSATSTVDRATSTFGHDVLVGTIKFPFFKVKCNEDNAETTRTAGEIWKKEKQKVKSIIDPSCEPLRSCEKAGFIYYTRCCTDGDAEKKRKQSTPACLSLFY